MSVSMTMNTAVVPKVGLTKARFINLVAASYMFLLIVRPAEYWQVLMDTHIEKISVLIFLAAVALSKYKKWHSGSLNVSVGISMCVLLVCMATSSYPMNGVEAIYNFLRLMVLYYLLQMLIVDETSLKEIVLAFLIITSLYIFKSNWEFFVNGRHYFRMGFARMVGMDVTYGDPNSFAATAVYSAPLALAMYKYFAHEKKFRMYIYGHFFLLMLVLLFTGSRSGQLTFAFYVFILIMMGKKKLAKLTGMALLAVLVLAVAPEEYSNRFLSIFDSSVGPANAAESAEQRSLMFWQAMSLFASNPLTGTGPDTFQLYSNPPLKPHNLYGQILAETGLLGGLAFVFFIRSLVSANRQALGGRGKKKAPPDSLPRLPRLLAVANLQTVVLLLFNGLASHNFYRYHWLFIAALSIGCQHLSRPQKKRVLVKGGGHAKG